MKIITDGTISIEEMEKTFVAKAPIVGWVSGGAASAVACHLALKTFPDMRLVRIDPLGELPDVGRFVADFSEKIGKPIETISVKTHGPERFHSAESHLDILRKVRGIKFPTGAPCTTILKRNVREAFCEQEGKRRPVYLDELDPERGIHLPIYVEDCGSVGEGCEIQRSIDAYRS